MIAVLSPRRSGFPLFGVDRSRLDSIEHRRGVVASASRWIRAVIVWIGLNLVGCALVMGVSAAAKLGADGWSSSFGTIDTLPEAIAWFIAMAASISVIRRKPQLGLALAHYGSFVALAVIAWKFDSFVTLHADGTRSIHGHEIIFFTVLAALSGVALWKANLAKGAFGPPRAES